MIKTFVNSEGWKQLLNCWSTALFRLIEELWDWQFFFTLLVSVSPVCNGCCSVYCFYLYRYRLTVDTIIDCRCQSLTPDESVVKKKVRLANRQLFCSCFFVFLMIFAKLLLSVVYFYSKNRHIYYSNLLVFSFSSSSTH